MSASISIVVPVHNCAALTRLCLDAVLADLPPGCEVIVVDDASTDGTRDLLAGYGDAVRTVSMARNGGYASVCNEGARLAQGELLVFLNNDTEPRGEWLAVLGRYSDAHPGATVVGAKLLYPTGTVQHAGVVIGQDGYPHNLYAGLPADHPAVNRSRRLQAVTGACMLVRHRAFEDVGGFDTGFVNSLEDVDLCLRIGERGGEVHYCHEVSLTHLESASRGREDRFQRSVKLYRERWRDRVRRDDLAVYAEDGLMSFEYADSYPLRVAVDPRLAVIDRGREEEIERLLESYARQVSDLLQEVVRLTALQNPGAGVSSEIQGTLAPTADLVTRKAFLAGAHRIEEEIRRLQIASGKTTEVAASKRLGYRYLVARVREAVEEHVPPKATVLVVSRGDRDLIHLEGRIGGHFPQDEQGRYIGHHPADSEEAIAHLERLRERGAGYLVLPRTASWWLDHYGAFATHLKGRYERLDADSCAIYDLAARVSAPVGVPAMHSS